MKKIFLIAGLVALIMSGCDILDADKPGTPLGVLALPLSSSSIIVRWTAIKNAESYDVYRSEIGSTGMDYLDNTGETTYTDENLEAETSYTYYIRAKNDSGVSNFSMGSTAKTLQTDVGNTGSSSTNAITITSAGVTGSLLLSSSERWYTFTKNGSGTLAVKDKGNAPNEYSADIMADIYTIAPTNGSNGVFAKINGQDANAINLGTGTYTSITQTWSGTYYVRVYLYPSLLNSGTFQLSFN